MERHQLEDRIRASLHERADDVQPTPALWERVSARTRRRARWQLGAWALSGAAAVVAVVVGGMALFGQPRGVEIQPGPEVVEEPDAPTPSETPMDTAPAPAATPTVVTTDGTSLFRVDADTGEVVQELAPFAGFAEPAAIRELAVRPVADGDELTVAMVIEVEGEFDVEVATFASDGARVDRQRLGMAAADAATLPPDVVWSEDGRFVMWAGEDVRFASVSGPALWTYDWQARPLTDEGLADTFSATAPGATAALFDGTGTVDLREWRGDPMGESTLMATTTTDGAFRLLLSGRPSDCGGQQPCPPTFEADVQPVAFEGGAVVDTATLGNGVALALATASGGDGAESATLRLLAEPMSDQQVELPVPELTGGTASPLDGWLSADGDRVVVGFGPVVGHLLTVTGDTVETLEVASTTALPEGTSAAHVATVAAAPAPGDGPGATPSPTATAAAGPALAEDGAPAHVVTHAPSDGTFALVDRRAPDRPLATWGRPTGVPAGLLLDGTVVWPGSEPGHLQVVTSWTSTEGDVLARTEVRDGDVVVNTAFPDRMQPRSDGQVLSRPVFDPTGDHLAWLEDATDGQALRVVRWQAGSPSADLGAQTLQGAPALAVLADWAVTTEGSVLTAMVDEATDQQVVEVRLLGSDGPIVLAEDTPTVVDLPGLPLAAGSFDTGDDDTRYVVFDDGDGVDYALADAPEAGVPTGLPHSESGRVVAFGPDSLVVQLGSGTWQRVQVDDGAASAMTAPATTRAFLPWPDA
jgi:hypothetical protein